MATVLLFAVSSNAADKVVVIPLNSSQRTTCTAPDEVLSQGQCWKDRNLGAHQVATSFNDTLAYGDLYQWGRPRDGHQHRDSLDTFTKSDWDDPPHGTFIRETQLPWDWRVLQNNNLWQGLGGINNPCPQGFRLPTETEFAAEVASWSSNDSAGAIASLLKLTAAGYRTHDSASLQFLGINGCYWTSTVSGIKARSLIFGSGASMADDVRAQGCSVRCIKN